MNGTTQTGDNRCWICGIAAEDTRFHFRFAGKLVPLCPSCMVMGRALVGMIGKLRDVAAEKGIFIGIPKSHQ